MPRSALATLDLPQPDSPTSPTVSPGAIARLTPSTALTYRVVRRHGEVRTLTGKVFTSASTSSSGTSGPASCSCDAGEAAFAVGGGLPSGPATQPPQSRPPSSSEYVGGCSWSQRSSAASQRGAYGQPGIGAI